MSSKKYFPSLVCGFGAAVLTTVPGIKSFGFCLLVPAAAVLSLFLHQKVTGTNTDIDSGTAITFGILTGLFAAVFATFFDVLITFFTHTNDFVQTLPQPTQSWYLEISCRRVGTRNHFGRATSDRKSVV